MLVVMPMVVCVAVVVGVPRSLVIPAHVAPLSALLSMLVLLVVVPLLLVLLMPMPVLMRMCLLITMLVLVIMAMAVAVIVVVSMVVPVLGLGGCVGLLGSSHSAAVLAFDVEGGVDALGLSPKQGLNVHHSVLAGADLAPTVLN